MADASPPGAIDHNLLFNITAELGVLRDQALLFRSLLSKPVQSVGGKSVGFKHLAKRLRRLIRQDVPDIREPKHQSPASALSVH